MSTVNDLKISKIVNCKNKKRDKVGKYSASVLPFCGRQRQKKTQKIVIDIFLQTCLELYE